MDAKKLLARLTAVCLLMTALSGGAASADSVTVKADRLNLRAQESASSKAVGIVEKGDELSFISESGDWYQVSSGSKTGFVMKDYVSLDKAQLEADVAENTEPFSGTAKATDRVNIRELPMTGSQIVKVLPKNSEAQLIGQCGVWYQVSYSGKTGYVMAKYLSVEQTGGSEVVPGNPADGETVYAEAKAGWTTARVNLREAASTGSDVVKVLSKRDDVTVLGEKGSFYKVSADGREGYVAKSYIELTGSADNNQDNNQNQDAVVPDGLISYPAARTGSLTARVNLREGATTASDVIRVLDKDEELMVLGENGSFYQVKAGSSLGYVSKNYVRLGESGSAEPEDDQNQGNTGSDSQTGVTGETLYAQVRDAQTTVKVNMRRAPEGDVLFVLPQYTSVQLIGEIGSWYKVTYSTSTGYISKSYVTEDVTAPEQPDNGGSTAPEISGNGTTGYVTGASVNMRKGPSTGYGVIKVLYAGDEVTFYAETDGWYQIKAGSDTGYISAKYISTTKPEAAPSNPGGNTDYENVTGKVQMADWWTSNIQSVFKVGVIATVTDVDTGLTWRVKRSGGSNHADVQPLTAADTAKMKQAYNGKWSWDRHAIWVTINGVSYAASMNGMPHGTGSITDNNFDGHHCIHFLNSRTHTGNRWDTAHQAAVQKAYKAGN